MSAVVESLKTWAERGAAASPRARAAAGVVAFAAGTAFAARVAVPIPGTAVPMTLQVVFVLLAGAVLGPRLGGAAMAVYLAAGAAGAPVFSGGGVGLPWLLGPTGGYLVAYPAAAFVAGLAARSGGGALPLLASMTAGLGLIYVGGASWLLLLTGQGPAEVLATAVVPFVVPDATKVLLALALARLLGPAGARGS